MTCIGEDDDGEAGEGGDGTRPLEDADGAAGVEGVAFEIVGDDEDDEVGDGEKGDDAGVLERVEPSEERKWDDDEPDTLAIACNALGVFSTYMNAVIQNCLSTKNDISPACGAKPSTTLGIRSPMMMR